MYVRLANYLVCSSALTYEAITLVILTLLKIWAASNRVVPNPHVAERGRADVALVGRGGVGAPGGVYARKERQCPERAARVGGRVTLRGQGNQSLRLASALALGSCDSWFRVNSA